VIAVTAMAIPAKLANLPVDISPLPSKCSDCEFLAFELHATGFGFVQNEAFNGSNSPAHGGLA
jgi:hypothetical protein